MSWREVWQLCLGYDVKRQHVRQELNEEFQSAVSRRVTWEDPEEEYLRVCEEIISAAGERFFLQGPSISFDGPAAPEHVSCVRSLRDVYAYNAQQDIVTAGEPPLDLVSWFHSKVRPERLDSTLRGSKPLLWITTSSELDAIEAQDPARRGDLARNMLGLEHDSGDHFVRFDIPVEIVAKEAHRPTTFDGGVRSRFVPSAAEDPSGWGRTMDANGRPHLREAVIPEVPCSPELSVRYLGAVSTPPEPIDPRQRAEMLTQWLKA